MYFFFLSRVPGRTGDRLPRIWLLGLLPRPIWLQQHRLQPPRGCRGDPMGHRSQWDGVLVLQREGQHQFEEVGCAPFEFAMFDMHTRRNGHIYSLVVAEMCAASALISIGTVLGKTNPVQLTAIALLEVTGFILNEWLLRSLLRVYVTFVYRVLFLGAGNGNVKALLVTPGAAPEQHHAASHLWPLFWTHARLDPGSEGMRGAIREGEISLQIGPLLNVGYEPGSRTREHKQMLAAVSTPVLQGQSSYGCFGPVLTPSWWMIAPQRGL